MWAVIKKEFKSYFCTPIGYVFIGIFLLTFSASFYFSIIQSQNINFEYMFSSIFVILGLGVIIPLLTMRSFSEERKTGTEQLLLTSPISLTKVVLGKFIAALLIVIITEICTLMYFAIICHYGVPNIPIALATLLGFLLFTMSYIAFGILISSLTENQIISGVVSIIFFIVTFILMYTDLVNYSFIYSFMRFTQGVIDIGSVIMFVSFTVMCLLLTIIAMQRRKSVK